MSVGNCRKARKRMIQRYKRPGGRMSVAQAIENERRKAARQAAAKKK